MYISERPPIDQANVESLRLRDGPTYDPSRRRRIEDQERMYVEDVEERKVRDYDATEADSLQRHEIERGSDILRQAYRQRWLEYVTVLLFFFAEISLQFTIAAKCDKTFLWRIKCSTTQFLKPFTLSPFILEIKRVSKISVVTNG